MYAILQQGGHQYRVEPGDRLLVERIPADIGSVIALEPILLLHDGTSAIVGEKSIAGARVSATVVAHRRGKKLRVFKYKPKKRYRRTLGYRSDLTELRVLTFLKKGEQLPASVSAAAKPVKPAVGEPPQSITQAITEATVKAAPANDAAVAGKSKATAKAEAAVPATKSSEPAPGAAATTTDEA